MTASRADTRAERQGQTDVSTFIAWAQAYASGDRQLEDFFFQRFREEFRPAVEAWVATRPLRNSQAPLTPFELPEYRSAERERAAELDKEASRQTEIAKQDNQRSDNYVLAVVLFASSLFFAGISSKLSRLPNRVALVTIGWVIFLATLGWILTFPVSVSV